MCGTPQLAAPEVAQGEAQTTKVDAWAIGACLVQMLKGRPMAGVQDASLPDNASPGAQNVGMGLLTIDVASRLSAKAALDYPFLNTAARAHQELAMPLQAPPVKS